MNENERIGFMGELLTQYRLAEYGIKSFLTDQPDHDLIAETSVGFKSIQVKSRSLPSDDRGNITFKTFREQDRHLSRGNYVSYNCDVFAFVYLPLETVIFALNTGKMSGGFNLRNFTNEMSDLSARSCGLIVDDLHARNARDTPESVIQSTFKFNFGR